MDQFMFHKLFLIYYLHGSHGSLKTIELKQIAKIKIERSFYYLLKNNEDTLLPIIFRQ